MKTQSTNFQKSLFHLFMRLQRQQQAEGGYSLVVTVAMLLILSTLLISAAIISKIDTVSTNASAKSNTGFYAAEAGLNFRARDIKATFEGYNRPSGTSPLSWQNCMSGSGSQGSNDFACDEVPFQGQQVWTYVEEFPNNPRPTIVGDGPFAGLSAQDYIYDVVSVATDQDTLTNQKSPSAILGMRFKSRLVPLFQFAAFYEQDMDFAIPPSMTVNGRVHSNNDLYLDASSSGTFSINGQVTSVGKLYRGEKIQNDCSGTVRIHDGSSYQTLGCSGSRKEYLQSDVKTTWPGKINVGVDKLEVPKPDQFDAQAGKLYWDKADLRVALVLNSSGNPTGIEVQDVDGSSNSIATADLRSCSANGATTTVTNKLPGLSIYLGTDTFVNVANATKFQADLADGDAGDAVVVIGNDIDSNVLSSTASSKLNFKRQLGHPYQILSSLFSKKDDIVRKAVVSTSDTFYNYREKVGSPATNKADKGRYIRMLDVNMGALFDCVQSQNLMGSKTLSDDTDGGLVWYFTVKGPDSNKDVTKGDDPNSYGVRLYNAAKLASSVPGAPTIKGLTVISDQAIYTRGNYNSINKKPAAILGDTINVLSGAWKMDDSNSRNYVGGVPSSTVTVGSLRQASTTTINAAFLAGIDISGGVNQGGQNGGWSSSGGGWNNYPRFHERWDGATLNYRGSMVTLGSPRRVNGKFCGSQSIDSSCNIYTPPTRNWDYDSDFDNAATLPPLTPQAVSLIQERFQREFDVSSKDSGKQYVATLPTFQPSFTF